MCLHTLVLFSHVKVVYQKRIEELLTQATERGGHQMVATDPTLIQEDISKPVRGSKVRAWVNIIYGCNEHCT